MVERGKTVFRTMGGKLHTLEIGCERKRIERDFSETELSLEFFGDEFLRLFIDQLWNDEKTRDSISDDQNNKNDLEPFDEGAPPKGGYAL